MTLTPGPCPREPECRGEPSASSRCPLNCQLQVGSMEFSVVRRISFGRKRLSGLFRLAALPERSRFASMMRDASGSVRYRTVYRRVIARPPVRVVTGKYTLTFPSSRPGGGRGARGRAV